MNAHPPAWLKPPLTIGGEVPHLVAGGVFLIRVLVERLVDDDRDGTETLDFSYRGVDYQIEVSAANARALDKLLAPILEVSRRREQRPVAPRSIAEPSGQRSGAHEWSVRGRRARALRCSSEVGSPLTSSSGTTTPTEA